MFWGENTRDAATALSVYIESEKTTLASQVQTIVLSCNFISLQIGIGNITYLLRQHLVAQIDIVITYYEDDDRLPFPL